MNNFSKQCMQSNAIFVIKNLVDQKIPFHSSADKDPEITVPIKFKRKLVQIIHQGTKSFRPKVETKAWFK